MDLVSVEGLHDLVEIGRGGFGVVYRGIERDLGRTVAVKVLPPLRDADTKRRFDRERLALGSMSGHPNIVTIHRSGSTDDSEPYLVMEFCDRGSIADRLETSGPMPWTEATDIAVKMAGALETAHRSGIVHRDIKPANILLSSLNEPKLADFGIARMEGAPETQSATITASLAHAAPEILNGERPDARSDVYGLASTLFEMILGTPAFVQPGDNMLAIISRIAQDPVPPALAERAPPALVSAIARGMAKEPENRPASAAAFGFLLTEAQQLAGRAPTPLKLDDAPVPPGTFDGDSTMAVDPPLPFPVAAAVAPLPANAAVPVTARRDQLTGQPPASPENNNRRSALLGISALVVTALVAAAGFLLFTGTDGAPEEAADTAAVVDGSDDSEDEPEAPAASSTSTSAPEAVAISDTPVEPLTIGTLLPITGPLATFGPTTEAGVQLAVEDINAAGGVLGENVDLVLGDSSDGSAEVLEAERRRLIDASVDAVVGPFLSGSSRYLLENPTEEPLVMISPSATSLELSTLDTDGVYFRTSPSEATQGTVLAQILSDTGIDRLALIHIDDPYGERLSDNIRQRYAQLGGVVVVTSAYDPFGDTSAVIEELLSTPADGIVIIGFNETVDIYAAITAAGIGPQGDGTPVFGVDANALLQGDPSVIDGYRSVLPQVDLRPLALFAERMRALDIDSLEEFPQGPESYDAAVIAALAAEQSGSTDALSIAAAINEVTKDGEKCFDFAECKRMLGEGLNIDYDGLAGPYELTDDGDPRVASYVILTYDGDDQPNSALNEYVFSR